MKKHSVIGALALTALLLSGCAQGDAKMEYIGADAAKLLAASSAGLSTGQITFTNTDLDTRNGVEYYRVAFTADGESYEYDIDATTGVIIDSKLPAVTAKSAQPAQDSLVTDADSFGATQPAQNNAAQPAQNNAAQSPNAVTGATVPANAAAAAQNSGQAVISEADAKAKALAHAGLSTSQVTFVKSYLDWDDGRQVYEVEFYTADYKEYDYEIDAYSGKVLSYDYDAEYYTPPAKTGNSTGSITADAAKDLALAQVPGATRANIREFKTDYDDGRLEYEGKIYYGNMEYEFTIDGYSGSIREWDVESIYD
ncbi:MAG: PepSY domain-containing protein [Agathobaculum sp.]|uniref:PepSY domain-containing protein n=1 Tax=Agathobaculum sp. TaxID=2048138 RepID=UPI002A8170E0|nr:PepSY domain-containing protein [Agathobaculum sp.]MDY3710843.1 PepSY domain-containing protein [Agathobaculum sp.]